MQSALPPGLPCLRNYCLKPRSQHARVIKRIVQLWLQALNARIVHRYRESFVRCGPANPGCAGPFQVRHWPARKPAAGRIACPTRSLWSRLRKHPSPIAERAVFAIAGEMPTVVRIAFFEELAPAFVPQLALLPGNAWGPGSRFVMLESSGRLINHFVTGLPGTQAKIHIVVIDRETCIEAAQLLENLAVNRHARASDGGNISRMIAPAPKTRAGSSRSGGSAVWMACSIHDADGNARMLD